MDGFSGSMKHLRFYNAYPAASDIRRNSYDDCFMPGVKSGLALRLPLNMASVNKAADIITGNTVTLDVTAPVLPTPHYPLHRMPTYYAYNSLNQVVEQVSPDAGLSKFWYDRMGRLVVSQNAEQNDPVVGENENAFSYTLYDDLGRIKEVGEKIGGENDLSLVDTRDPVELGQWMTEGTKRQITQTIYDNPDPLITWDNNIMLEQIRNHNSRKRVVTSIFREVEDAPEEYNFATHYVYDISGNVKKLYQENRKLGNQMVEITRSLDYEYDLVSGKVNRVWYQKGMQDQYLYDYVYDADNKLLEALSGRDEATLRHDARYYYHLHGPLARTELAHDPVQGVDYAYTLQGWLKGINGVFLNEPGTENPYDLGYDGVPGGKQANTPGDVYAYSIGYYNNDYQPVDDRGGYHPFTALTFNYNSNGNPHTGYQLFNGNIAYTSFASSMLDNRATTGYSYRYDQLNRLVGMRSHNRFNPGGSWSYSTINDDYTEEVSYDPNGNIMTYLRNGAAATGIQDMDQLTYTYSNPGQNNLLDWVDDAVSASNYSEDIDAQSQGNYQYDRIGNLINDVAEDITSIEWTVYGKIRRIEKGNGVIITYYYDPAGNRISKEVDDPNEGIHDFTYYFRDAQGNVMGVYKQQPEANLVWQEQHLYGGSRLGMWVADEEIVNEVPDPYLETVIGSRHYELTNHLGNVLTVVTDKKTYNGNYWEAEVINVSDYYPFGMLMPGRSYTVDAGYRYGFNGKENDNEVKGEGNSLDFGARIYDSRIGRWLSVDPLQIKYPGLSPYNFAGNSPILCIDPDGRIIRIYYDGEKYYDYTPGVELSIDNDILKAVVAAAEYNMNTVIGKEVWTQLSSSSAVVEIYPVSGRPVNQNIDAFKAGLGKKTRHENQDLLGTITWNIDISNQVVDAYSGMKGFHSPSTILFHEIGHAQEADNAYNSTDPNAIYKYNASGDPIYGYNQQYDTNEEKKNTETRENIYIRQINAWEQQNNPQNPLLQPLRYNHKYNGYPNKSGNVNIIDPKDYLDWLQENTEKNDEIKSKDRNAINK